LSTMLRLKDEAWLDSELGVSR